MIFDDVVSHLLTQLLQPWGNFEQQVTTSQCSWQVIWNKNIFCGQYSCLNCQEEQSKNWNNKCLSSAFFLTMNFLPPRKKMTSKNTSIFFQLLPIFGGLREKEQWSLLFFVSQCKREKRPGKPKVGHGLFSTLRCFFPHLAKMNSWHFFWVEATLCSQESQSWLKCPCSLHKPLYTPLHPKASRSAETVMSQFPNGFYSFKRPLG